MDVRFALDVPTIMGLVALVLTLVVTLCQRLAIEVAAIIILICIGLIFTN